MNFWTFFDLVLKTFDRMVHDSWEGSIDAEKKKGKEREEVEEEVKELEEGRWDGKGEGG